MYNIGVSVSIKCIIWIKIYFIIIIDIRKNLFSYYNIYLTKTFAILIIGPFITQEKDKTQTR